MIAARKKNRLFRFRSAAGASLCAAAAIALHGQTAAAQGQAPAYTDPRAVDAAIADFVGAANGEPGGARHVVDRRLKLSVCSAPLALDWHGKRRDTVKVGCPDRGGWQIFVAIAPAAGEAGEQAETVPIVNRGDAVSIMVRGNGFSVTQAGEALEGGAAGDWIRVRPTETRDALHARVERPGLVIVPAG